MNQKDHVYLVLGTKHIQRLRICFQFAEYLLNDGKVELFFPTEEKLEELESELIRLKTKGLKLTSYEFGADKINVAEGEENKSGSTKIWVSNGTSRLVDFLEVFSKTLRESGAQLERVITWVDCPLLGTHTDIDHWYKCCYHFSDLVLLDRFAELGPSWLKEYKDSMKSEYFPFIIGNTKKGRVSDLRVTLDNQVRRLTQVFEWTEEDLITLKWSKEWDDEEGDDEEIVKDDPYFERLPDNRRSKHVSDVSAILPN